MISFCTANRPDESPGVVSRGRRRRITAILPCAMTAMLALTATASAGDIEVPTIVLDANIGDGAGENSVDLDLANLVEAAAKGRTTVQEAPAIVTVITGDEIADRGLTNLEEVIDIVPGWLRLGALHSQFPFALTRGTLQASMYMHNGVSLFEPVFNAPTFSRIMPLEIIKRVEMITGPGGVLWGANSYMGIVNVITKDADDVDGVEAGVRFGDGNGDRGMARGYAMAGIRDILDKDVDLLLHTSFETYLGPGFEMPLVQFASTLPQPNAPTIYGPLTRSDPRRSLLFNIDGKLEAGPLTLSFMFPWSRIEKPLGFSGTAVRFDLIEDEMCPDTEPLLDPTDQCVDKGRRAREHRPDFYDRYLMADYQTRFNDGRAGISAKAYLVQFVRRFVFNSFSPSPLVEGGVTFDFDGTSYRTGTSVDGDLELPRDLRLLYGFEVFREWFGDRTTGSRQGAGIESVFRSPYDLERLPLPCPLQPDGQGGVERIAGCPVTLAFSSDRSVIGAYLNPTWRLAKKLIIDGGVRAQLAPEVVSDQPYSAQLLLSGALVYNFWPGWHGKINYAEGARPPVFTNTNANGEAAQIGGDPDLVVETSQAIQGEINGRIFKGKRRIRELNFRADYSYTRLNELIQIVSGQYQNTGRRGIHSAEFLGKLYIQGGHRLELSYSWLRMNLDDKGRHRSMPEHWFNLAGFFNLIDGKLAATTNLRVLGAMEDANRLVEHRDLTFDENGQVINANTGDPDALTVLVHEVTIDRLPPGADLSAGLIYTGVPGLRLMAMAHNAFNARYYQPDAFFDYEPRIEYLPNPYEDFRFVVDAVISY